MQIQILELKLTTKSFLTIGSEEASIIQRSDINQLKRINRLKPRVCIPATTFKGILRTSAGQIAHFFSNEKEYCNTVNTNDMCRNCVLCNIFGASNLPSKLYCEDAYPKEEALIELDVYTRNRIDRKTRKTEEKGLFSSEQIPPGISFSTSITGKNLSTEQQVLLLAALKNINYCSIGRGNGLIDLKILKSQNFDQKSQLITNLLEVMSKDD